MKNIIIIGNGPYAQMMHRYINLTDCGEMNVVAYAVDEKFILEKSIQGVDVISFEKMYELYPTQNIRLIMGIGYKEMGNIRKRVFEYMKEKEYKFLNYIHPTANIASNFDIGEGNNILEGVLIEESVKIGNANLFFGNAIIGHESSVGNYNTVSLRGTIAGCVTIKSNCFMGVASAVKDHVTLEDYVLLGAMAYGYKDIDAYSVVMPAKSVIAEGKNSLEYL